MSAHSIRPIDPESSEEIDLVARRMRATLVEVVDPDRGQQMYSLDWLRARVRWHLEPNRQAAVFVAELGGEIVGHTIVREDRDGEGARLGLFSTTYVSPEFRRAGIAQGLLRRGEQWIEERQLGRARTYTAHDNEPLIRLYEQRGYTRSPMNAEMVCLERTLT